MKKILLFWALLLTGCGGIIINPYKCHGNIEIGKSDERYNREIEKDYFVFLDDREIFLKDVLDCNKVTKLKINLKQSYLFNYKLKFIFKEE